MQEYQSIHWIKNQLHITQAVKQKPQLNYIIGKLDRGEISVNEAEETIKFEEEYDAEQKEKGKWRRLRALK